MEKAKKPIYKRWWFILVAVIVGLGVLGSIVDDEDDQLADEDEEKVAEVEEGSEEEEKKEEKEVESVGTSEKSEEATESDDDFFTGKPRDVRNDTTGNWKMTTTSESIDIKERATEYVEKYMEDGEVHFIIDFAKNNTYQLNKYGETVYLTIYEYVDKEEHDAKTIGRGMLLGEYVINKDGEAEEIKEE